MADTNVMQNDSLVLAADLFAAALQRTTLRVDALAKSVGIVVQAIKGVRQQGSDATTVPGGTGGKGGKDEETNDKLKDWAKSVGAALESAFNRGKSALFSFVEAADPSAMSTFHASVTMLQQAIGEGLSPYIDAASRQIQQWAKWFRNLDGDTKATIIRISLLVGSLGGLVMIGKTLVPVIMSAVSALRLMGAVAMMSPVGAIVGLTAAVAGLAAAWYSVAGAAKDATGAQNQAGNARPGVFTAEGVGFNQDEIENMPAKYRDQFKRYQEVADQIRNYDSLPEATKKQLREKLLTKDQREAVDKSWSHALGFENAFPQEWRDARLKELDSLQQNLVRQYQRDIPAQLDTLPEFVRRQIAESPNQRLDIIKRYQEDERNRVASMRQAVPETVERSRERATKLNLAMQQAASSKDFDTVLQEQLAAYIKRKDIRNPGDAPRQLNLDRESPEYRAIRSAFVQQIEKFMPNTDVSGREIDQMQIVRPDGQFPVRAAAKAPTLTGKTFEDALKNVQREEGRVSLLSALTDLVGGKTGGGDGFLQNLKSPVQSRFTDPFQYAESVQTAVLNQGDADAKILADRMAFLAQKLGDAVGMVEKFMQSQQRQSASSWLGGTVTITDR